MKKILSMFLAVCLLITSGIVSFAAEEAEQFVINNLSSNVVDYYHNGLSNAEKLEKSYFTKNASDETVSGGIILRPAGEWAKWSIEGISSGKYDISVEMEHNSTNLGQFIVYVDDYTALVYQHDTQDECVTDNKNVYNTHILGSVEIPEGAKTIKIKNDSRGSVALHLGRITLTKNDNAEILPLKFATPITSKTEYYEKNGDSFVSSASVVKDEDYYIVTASDTYTNTHMIALGGTYPYTIHRAGHWSKYNIEGLKPGNYKMSMELGTKDGISTTILVDGKEKVKTSVASTGGYTKYTTNELGEFYIGKNAKYLTFKLNSNSNATYTRKIILEYVSSDVNQTIKAKDADDFYALDGGAESESLELSSDSVVLTNTEWVSYDLGELPDSLYDVKINAKSSSAYGVFYSIYLGEDLITKIKLENTSSFSDVSVGTIEIKGEENLKIVSEGRYASFIDSIIITDAAVGATVSHNLRIYADNSTATNENGTVTVLNGTDFYETSDLAYSDSSVVAGSINARIHHATEWTRYSIKGIKSGTYNVTQNVGAKAGTVVTTLYAGDKDALINGNLLISSAVTKYGNYLTSESIEMGTVYIPEGTEYFWIRTTGDAAYMYSFDFEFISEEDVAAAYDISLVQHYIYTNNTNKNNLTGKTLALATDKTDYKTGDFYDTENSKVHILWTVDNVSEVYLLPTEWTKYNTEVPKGLYDLTVKYSIYKSTVGSLNIKFLDKNQNIIASESVKTILETSGSKNRLNTKIEDVIIPDNALYVVVEGAEGQTSFNSLTLTPSIGAKVEYTLDEAGENKIEKIDGASSVYAQVSLANGKGKENVTVIVARYNGGQLVDVVAQPNVSVGRNEIVIKTFKVDLEAGYSVRTFVWSDITDSMIPLCASGDISQ